MFGLIRHPFYDYDYGYDYGYEPLFVRRRFRADTRGSRIQTYIRNVQRRLAEILYDEFDQQIVGEDCGSSAEPHPEQDMSASPDAQKEKSETGQPQQAQQPQQIFSSRSSSFVRANLDEGGRLVEEHRERVTGGDGSVHVVTRRQIGDRWYTHESHVSSDGTSSTKETWHNVGDDETASFKKEWEDMHSIKHEEPQPQQLPPEETNANEK